MDAALSAKPVWYKRHGSRVIAYYGVRPDNGREIWHAECECGWYGQFISRRAAELAYAQHKGPW